MAAPPSYEEAVGGTADPPAAPTLEQRIALLVDAYERHYKKYRDMRNKRTID